MNLGIAVLAAVFAALLVGFIAFYRHSHTEAWRKGDTRAAALGFLITIAPFFGGRVAPPQPEIPVVMTPGPDQEDIIPGLSSATPATAGNQDDAQAAPTAGRTSAPEAGARHLGS